MKEIVNIPVRVQRSWQVNDKRFTLVSLTANAGYGSEDISAIVEGVPSFIKNIPSYGDVVHIPIECETDDNIINFNFGKKDICIVRETLKSRQMETLNEFDRIIRPAKVLVYGNQSSYDDIDAVIMENGYRLGFNEIKNPERKICGKLDAIIRKSMNFMEFTDFIRKRLYLYADIKNDRTTGLWKSLLLRYINDFPPCHLAWVTFLKKTNPANPYLPSHLFPFVEFMGEFPPSADWLNRLFSPIEHCVEISEFSALGLFEIREILKISHETHEIGKRIVKNADFTEDNLGTICVEFIAGVRDQVFP